MAENETLTTSIRGRYSKIPVDTFENLQMKAGIVLTDFDPATGTFDMEDLLCATSGGLNISLTDETRDNADGIDNAPKGVMELMEITDRNATVQLSSVTFSENFLRYAMSAADYDSTTKKITPRFRLQTTDFKDIWVVGDKLDGSGIAFHLKRALSANGLTWKTTDNGKGTLGLTLSGHYTLANQDDVPYEWYLIDKDTSTTFSVTYNLTNVTSTNTDTTVDKLGEYTTTLEAETGYTMGAVSVKVGGIDITSSVYNSETGVITIPSVNDNLVITATAEE